MSDEVLDIRPNGHDLAEFPRALGEPLAPDARVAEGPFPLEAAERSVTIRDRRRDLVHVFGPIGAADWIEFERLTRAVVETEGDRARSDSMEAEAADWLWDKSILRIDGYGALPEDWKRKVWLRHKQAALAALTQIFEWEDAPGMPTSMLSDEIAVLLEAACNGQRYVNLRHVFREPETSHQIAWSRNNVQLIAIRGQRRGVAKHIVMSNLPFKLQLYDELIARVEGYEPNEPKKMDALHKKVAIEALMGNG